MIAGGNEAAALDFLKYATAEEQVKFMMNTMGYISSDKTIVVKMQIPKKTFFNIVVLS